MGFLITVIVAYVFAVVLTSSLQSNPNPRIISIETSIPRGAGFSPLPLIILNMIMTTMLIVVRP